MKYLANMSTMLLTSTAL